MDRSAVMEPLVKGNAQYDMIAEAVFMAASKEGVGPFASYDIAVRCLEFYNAMRTLDALGVDWRKILEEK